MKTRRETLTAGAGLLGAAALVSVSTGAGPAAAASANPARARVEAWLRAYKAAWETRDADAVTRIFTADATYRDHAFQPPFVGRPAIREYWAKTVAEQSNIAFSSTVWSVEGNVAIAHWAATFDAGADKKPAKLDGVFHLTFNGLNRTDPLCSELLEWWFFG